MQIKDHLTYTQNNWNYIIHILVSMHMYFILYQNTVKMLYKIYNCLWDFTPWHIHILLTIFTFDFLTNKEELEEKENCRWLYFSLLFYIIFSVSDWRLNESSTNKSAIIMFLDPVLRTPLPSLSIFKATCPHGKHDLSCCCQHPYLLSHGHNMFARSSHFGSLPWRSLGILCSWHHETHEWESKVI